jgi:hypothetical protein
LSYFINKHNDLFPQFFMEADYQPGKKITEALSGKGHPILFGTKFQGSFDRHRQLINSFCIVPRIQIKPYHRALFPSPLKGIYGQGRPAAEKVPPPLEDSPQGRTQQGLAEAPGPEQEKTLPDPVSNS